MNNYDIGLLQKLAVNKNPIGSNWEQNMIPKTFPTAPLKTPPPIQSFLPKDHIAENKRLEGLLRQNITGKPLPKIPLKKTWDIEYYDK